MIESTGHGLEAARTSISKTAAWWLVDVERDWELENMTWVSNHSSRQLFSCFINGKKLVSHLS